MSAAINGVRTFVHKRCDTNAVTLCFWVPRLLHANACSATASQLRSIVLKSGEGAGGKADKGPANVKCGDKRAHASARKGSSRAEKPASAKRPFDGACREDEQGIVRNERDERIVPEIGNRDESVPATYEIMLQSSLLNTAHVRCDSELAEDARGITGSNFGKRAIGKGVGGGARWERDKRGDGEEKEDGEEREENGKCRDENDEDKSEKGSDECKNVEGEGGIEGNEGETGKEGREGGGEALEKRGEGRQEEEEEEEEGREDDAGGEAEWNEEREDNMEENRKEEEKGDDKKQEEKVEVEEEVGEGSAEGEMARLGRDGLEGAERKRDKSKDRGTTSRPG